MCGLREDGNVWLFTLSYRSRPVYEHNYPLKALGTSVMVPASYFPYVHLEILREPQCLHFMPHGE